MDTRFRAIPEQGYFLQPCNSLPAGAPKHFLGDDGEVTADCSECGMPLTTVLQLDSSDPRLALPPLKAKWFRLLVCGHCRLSASTYTSTGEILCLPDIARGFRSQSAQILQPPPRSAVVVHEIPERILNVRTLALEHRLDEAGDWVKKFDWQRPINQVGGTPVLPEGPPSSPACPLCSEQMPFFACVVCPGASQTADNDQTGEAVCFFLCRGCYAVIGRGSSIT